MKGRSEASSWRRSNLLAWCTCVGLILLALGGASFLAYSRSQFREQAIANKQVEELIAEGGLQVDNGNLEAAQKLFSKAENIPKPTNRNRAHLDNLKTRIDELQSRLEVDAAKRRSAEFALWVQGRLRRQGPIVAYYDSLFAGFRAILERESRTPDARRELEHVNQLFDTVGFDAFLIHYKRAILDTYTVGNFREDRESRLRELIESRKLEIMQSIIDAIAKAIPKKE